jgi:hypothetical protein
MVKRQLQKLVLSSGTKHKRHKICHVTRNLRGPQAKRTKCVQFGDRRYGNYTTHKDPKRKQSYIKRHKKRENWRDMSTAGFWAKNLLWNKPTLGASIKDVEKKFRVRITRK